MPGSVPVCTCVRPDAALPMWRDMASVALQRVVLDVSQNHKLAGQWVCRGNNALTGEPELTGVVVSAISTARPRDGLGLFVPALLRRLLSPVRSKRACGRRCAEVNVVRAGCRVCQAQQH